jgi:hypothetical protein
MKRILIAGAAISTLFLLAVGPLSGAAASTTLIKVQCGIRLTDQIPPGRTTLGPPGSGGSQFGTTSCGKPLGKGVAATSFTTTPTSANTGVVSGAYTQFFARGTVHGKFKLTFTASMTGSVSYVGGATIAGGTGRFAGAKGHAGLTCSSPDGGIHTSCTEKIKLTRL